MLASGLPCVLRLFLGHAEMRVFSCADVFAAQSADGGGYFGEVLRTQELFGLDYDIVVPFVGYSKIRVRNGR